MISAAATESTTVAAAEVEFAECACCGLTEECTPTYIAKVRERYQGRWICGLCAEAVKDEAFRSERRITAEEALSRHMSFCSKFNSSIPPAGSSDHLITAVKQIVRRSLDSPRAMRSTPSSPVRKEDGARGRAFVRSGSCFGTLAR